MEKQSPIIKLIDFKNNTLIQSLEEMLAQAKTGHIIAAAIAVKHEPFVHSIGIFGEYATNPFCALRVVNRMHNILCERADKMEGWK